MLLFYIILVYQNKKKCDNERRIISDYANKLLRIFIFMYIQYR